MAACLCHVLVCSIDDPAESGGVIVLWSIVWDRYACIQSYMGLCSYDLIMGTFTLPEDGQVMTETCRRFRKF